MEKTIGGKTYRFNCKLGTTIKIRKAFNKPFNSVLSDIEKYDIDDLIKLLYCGLDENEHSKEDFTNHLYDNIGLGELYELVQHFIMQIQFPGLSEEEIEKKIKEQREKSQNLINMTS